MCNGNNGFTDTKKVLEPKDDAATVNWGGAWRMPTKAEYDELRNNCTWKWTRQNGVNGYKVLGPNGNSIFLPTAGYMIDGSILLSAGRYGSYMLSSLHANKSDFAYCMSFFSDIVIQGQLSRENGQTVRPVCL